MRVRYGINNRKVPAINPNRPTSKHQMTQRRDGMTLIYPGPGICLHSPCEGVEFLSVFALLLRRRAVTERGIRHVTFMRADPMVVERHLAFDGQITGLICGQLLPTGLVFDERKVKLVPLVCH